MDINTKKMLKEGRYWEALKPPGAAPSANIDARIFELEIDNQGDQEALVLLAEVKQDLVGNKYEPARLLCDDLFRDLGGDVMHPAIRQGFITREGMWRIVFRPNISDLPAIRERTARVLKSSSIRLFNDSFKPGLTFYIATEAQNTGLRLLEVAQKYSPNIKDIEIQIYNARIMKAKYLCNHGVGLINKAQEDLKIRCDSLSNSTEASSGPILKQDFSQALAKAANEIESGVNYIQQAGDLDQHNSHIKEQLEKAREILKDVMQQANGAGMQMYRNKNGRLI